MANAFSLKSKTDLHLLRKIWHIFGTSMIAIGYFYFFSKKITLIILAFLIGFYSFVEITRIYSPKLHEKIIRNWKWMLRESERTGINTGLFALISCFLSILIFPKLIATLCIFYLAIGDPVASFFGILYGNKSINISQGKTLVGTLSGCLACCFVTAFFAFYLVPQPKPFALSLIGGLAGGTSELLILKVDDNLTIPLISGTALWITFILFSM